MVVQETKMHACSPKDFGRTASLADVGHKTGVYQRATRKCNALCCKVCSQDKFHKQIGRQKASAAACLAPTVPPNCHLPYPTCCLLGTL